MIGRASWRERSRAAVGCLLAATLVVAACASDDEESLPTTSSTASTTSTTATTTTSSTTTSTTSTTLSELAQAEADIEAAIIGWWTHPSDSSLGDAGMPLEYLSDPMLSRVRQLGERRTADGHIQRARGNAQIGIVAFDIDLLEGTAEVEVCALGDDEVIDAQSGEVLAADIDTAFVGSVLAILDDGRWTLRDFFSSQAGDNPEECLPE